MTNWQDIQKEIQESQQNLPKNSGISGYDLVRRNKYKLIKKLTGRPLLVYATAFHNNIKARVAPHLLPIDLSDKDGFYEITRDIPNKEIDIFVHSPGGSAEATESIVKIIRNNFENVRFIITGAAKSAATMLVLSGDSILMDKAAELGPIDPQVRVRNRYSPAGAIIEQFDKAAEELKKDPSQLPVWLPILQEFAPSLLVECENFISLAKNLVTTWLTEYMLQGDKMAKKKAKIIADYLTNEKN